LIADDQDLVRAGFSKILEAEPDIHVAGEASDGLEAISAAAGAKPDVVLMDIRMPGTDGIEATRRIVAGPGEPPRILMLTTFGIDEYVYESLRAGASGFMLKDAPPQELIDAVRTVAGGEALLSPKVTRSVIEEFVRRAPEAPPGYPELEDLTEREREVLELLTTGLSNSEIAESLHISEATAKTHVARILLKLGVRDRVQAVIYAYESGLVKLGQAGR
jgi:DNA-binding NarL/FixJ family response regulator